MNILSYIYLRFLNISTLKFFPECSITFILSGVNSSSDADLDGLLAFELLMCSELSVRQLTGRVLFAPLLSG